ncbi:helix-turn-helix domain-containing protein [Chryseobacterium sp. 2987]|uniref:helix-turn-helix domain-containing protein n=1 Tax=Chryseobacterium sp. 2987 TaxID=2817767 RepID=UPI00286513CB|nr:helix-turn-helix domain-containing protein [Chryseobacterium sp. 2987]MDR6919479.1 excisionase family DNA binding protein [Chryseobacterium sp. 2987]
MKVRKICEHCGLEFIAQKTVTKYCSHKCASRAYKVNVRELKVKLTEATQEIPSQTTSKPKEDPNSYFALRTLDYLTVKEAAVLLKCDKRTVYRMVANGSIPAANLSIRKIRILKKDIDELFKINLISSVVQKIDSSPIEETPLRDCFTIGQIQEEFSISQTSLKTLIKNHNIPKFQKGKFVYIPKREIEHILKKILSGTYNG